jgi:hypothetical protein
MKPLGEVTERAIRILFREMGVVDTMRFQNQFSFGSGNYTEEREVLFRDLSLADILSDIRGASRGST